MTLGWHNPEEFGQPANRCSDCGERFNGPVCDNCGAVCLSPLALRVVDDVMEHISGSSTWRERGGQ